MPLSLSAIVDGVTAVAAASVNQFKTAIELIAGAGWNDGAGDLTLEQVSDEVRTARGSAVSLDARIDAAHNADGTHANSSVEVADMAASALSGKGNTAARPAAAKAGYLYYNTQTGLLERDSGAAFETISAVFSAAQRDDLTDAGDCTSHTHTGLAPGAHAATHSAGGSDPVDVANLADATGTRLTPTQKTDLTDGGDCTSHTHGFNKRTLYVDSTGSAAAGVDAAALPEYENNITEHTMVARRIAFQKAADFNRIGLRAQYYASSTTKAPQIQLAVGATTIELTMTVATTWTDFDESDLVLDVSGLTNGVSYELDVNIINTPSGTALGKCRYLHVVHYLA